MRDSPFKVLFFVAAIALALTAGTDARPRHGGIANGTTPPVTCPYGSTLPDGCTTAPHVGLYTNPTFFTNTANFSGITVVRPAWNVAGVDYGVGQYTADGGLTDIISGSIPAECTKVSAHDVVCSGTGTALTITGYILNDVCFELKGSHTAFIFTNNHVIVGANINNNTCGNGAPTAFDAVTVYDQATSVDDEFNTYDMGSQVDTEAFWGDQRTTAHSNSGGTKHWYNYSPSNISKLVRIDQCGD